MSQRMLRAKLQQFMIGRCGPDQLSHATMWTAIVLWIIYFFTGWLFLYILVLGLMGITIYRMLSRNIAQRRKENNKFLTAIRPVQRRLSSWRTRMSDREHRYFRCPNCKQQMRVPRGKGHIQVTCRNCGITFEERS